MSGVNSALADRCSVRLVSAIADDDGVLLERMRVGDDRALATVYDRHSGLVFGLARRITGDDQIACDVSQEVFVALWEHPERVDLSRGSLRVWLGMVTHHRAVDVIRSSERRRLRERAVAADASMETVGPDVVVADNDRTTWRAQRLRLALDLLSPDQRAAVELAYFGGCSYREVATRLGIPEGTAKSRLRLALAQLRLALDNHKLAWT